MPKPEIRAGERYTIRKRRLPRRKDTYCDGVALPSPLVGCCGWLLVVVGGCSLPVVAMLGADATPVITADGLEA